MNTFKRKALASAVLGTLGVAGSAQAIYQDPNNLGQALIYPYYTVNSVSGNAFNTFVSVVNTTTAVKVVKVRFREGKNSAEVLDFNLYLSPNDMWTGAVIPSTSDPASPGHLVTADVSCTNPPIPSGGVDFRNFQYSGVNADVLTPTLDRTREGYAEMFEMATLVAGSAPALAATHSATTGVPTCTGLTGQVVALAPNLLPPTGGLMGTGTLINVNSGRDTMYNANAFGLWSATQVYTDIGNDNPNFNATNPASSIVVVVAGANALPSEVYLSTWAGTAVPFIATAGGQAASATMMHSEVLNEYILDAATLSDTDWVFTFPTKSKFVSSVTATPPFTNVLTANGACETIALSFFNREERGAGASLVDFSPTQPGAAPNSLCWESTVLSFRNASTNAPTAGATSTSLVLGSSNVTNVSVTSTFQNGWADVAFTGTNATTVGLVSLAAAGTLTTNIVTGVTSAAAQTFHGLPVVGFMIRTFSNGTLSCGTATCQGNYGGSVSHAFRNSDLPQP
jgi:hypothetical protein